MNITAVTPYNSRPLKQNPHFGQHHHLPPHTFLITDVSSLDSNPIDRIDWATQASMLDNAMPLPYADVPPPSVLPFFQFMPWGSSPLLNEPSVLNSQPSHPRFSLFKSLLSVAQTGLTTYGALTLAGKVFFKDRFATV